MRLLESYFIAFAIMNACGRRTTDVFTVLFFVLAYALLKRFPAVEQKKDSIIAAVCSGMFTLFYVLGNMEALSGGLTNKLFLVFYFGCTIIGLLCLFYRCMVWILVNSTKVKLFEEGKKFPVKMWLLLSALLFLCMIPLWLTNYPAVMTPDSLSQYRQAVGISNYSDHHPWFHTMIFKLFYDIGYALSGEIYTSIAVYTVVQMLLVALSVGYIWCALYELGLKKKYCIAGVIVFAIYPYNLIYAVTIWKDILFSVAVWMFTITLFRIYCAIKENSKVKNRDLVLFLLAGFFMCMLRHNGFYAFLGATPFILWFYRRIWKKTVPLTVIILAVCFLIKGPVMTYADVKPGEFAYKLCVPLQQIARVVYDGCELTDDEIAQIEKINDFSYIKENYQKHGADNMTSWVSYGNQEYLEQHKAEYLGLWLKIGLRYPGKYVQAFVDLTKGYWYPMDPGQVVFYGITQHETGLESQAVFSGPVVVKIHEILTKLYTIFPIYGIMYSMGALFWAFVISMAISFRNTNHGVWIAGIPLLLVMVTLFVAVPLVADLRYAYPLVIAIPSIAAITFKNTQEDTNEKLHE